MPPDLPRLSSRPARKHYGGQVVSIIMVDAALKCARWPRNVLAHAILSRVPYQQVGVDDGDRSARQPRKQPSEARRQPFEVLAHAILSRVPYQQVGVDDGDRSAYPSR